MRKRDNFYIYFSIFSLIFIFVLVYFFYEKKYCLSDFLDVKTVIQTLGTLFGAYFGARVAGKYAVSSAEKQIIAREEKDRLKERKVLMKCISMYLVHVISLQKFLKGIHSVTNKPKGFGVFVKDIDVFEGIRDYTQKKLSILKDVDLSDVYTDEYFIFLSALEDMSQIISILNDMIESMKNDEEELYHNHKALYDEVLIHLDEDVTFLGTAKDNISL